MSATERAQKMFDALKRIAKYRSCDQLRRAAEQDYGISAEEAIEYAYENVIEEARRATKGMRRPEERKKRGKRGQDAHATEGGQG